MYYDEIRAVIWKYVKNNIIDNVIGYIWIAVVAVIGFCVVQSIDF